MKTITTSKRTFCHVIRYQSTQSSREPCTVYEQLYLYESIIKNAYYTDFEGFSASYAVISQNI